MTFAESIQLATVIIAGLTMLGGLLTVYLKLKGAGNRRMDLLIERIDNNTLEMKQHSDMQIQRLNGMLTYLMHSFEVPAWLKVASTRKDGGVEFRMLELNSKYEEAFGIDRDRYLNRTDLEAGWPFKVAEIFRQNDLMVWASGVPVTVVEHIDGKPRLFRKIRVESPDGATKGIFGFEVCCPAPQCQPTICPVKTGEFLKHPRIEVSVEPGHPAAPKTDSTP